MSQKMPTQTVRHMERDGLLVRTVHAVVPPKVEYRFTTLGLTLGAAFCGVWMWAVENLDGVEQARQPSTAKPGRADIRRDRVVVLGWLQLFASVVQRSV